MLSKINNLAIYFRAKDPSFGSEQGPTGFIYGSNVKQPKICLWVEKIPKAA